MFESRHALTDNWDMITSLHAWAWGQPRERLQPSDWVVIAMMRILFAFAVLLLMPSSALAAQQTILDSGPAEGPQTTATGVAPPNPPAAYTLPASSVRVTTSAGLSSALAGSTKDIVLADGSYGFGGCRNIDGHNLWAENLAKATITSGVDIHSGSVEIHGLRFDNTQDAVGCTDNGAGGQSSLVQVWGTGKAKLYDARFNGHFAFTGAVYSKSGGLRLERVVINGFREFGVRSWANNPAPAHQSTIKDDTIKDVDCLNVHEPTPGSDGGELEQCLLLSWPVTGGVTRLRVADSFIGLEPYGNFDDTTVRDFTAAANQPSITSGGPNNVAAYFEHTTVSNTMQRFRITGNWHIGVVCEWNYGVVGNGACQGNTWRRGSVQSEYVGIYFDEGQEGNLVDTVSFTGQSGSAIVDYGP
jgi:hypothetical protein